MTIKTAQVGKKSKHAKTKRHGSDTIHQQKQKKRRKKISQRRKPRKSEAFSAEEFNKLPNLQKNSQNKRFGSNNY